MEFKNYFSRQVWDLRNVKLRIKKLEVHNEIKQVLSTLAPCLDESSYPLESLELVQQFFTSDDLFNHHIIQTAKDLRIIGIHGNFHRLPNLRVHIQKVNVSPATLIKAIDYWLTRGKEIGTHFSISSCEMLEEEARVLWKAIRTNYIDLVEENQRLIDFSPEPLKIKSRFFSELWFNVVKESGNTWICDLQVRKTRA
ncbi:FBA_2 domain-containing protein [Caenorhabditis elegans]|nr:FBA_2 domain-containing protein [Caenorhabditis elegans]CUV67069.1 FBA_2 domain-containing protein [Caenorhabditis elegans]|eukprot:NP_001305216.1 F-box C protein [Caenorhabditis elegans]